jgi:hypothetical protein
VGYEALITEECSCFDKESDFKPMYMHRVFSVFSAGNIVIRIEGRLSIV